MKRIKIFSFILSIILLSSPILFAQEPDTLWTKVIGGDSDDVAFDVEELWDGGFAVCGYTKSFFPNDFDVWLFRIDANGNIIWQRRYGGGGADYGYSMKVTDDRGFIIGGATNSFGAGGLDFYLIRTDSLGNTLWTKTFGGINDDICWSVDKTIDGGFIFAGEKDAFPEVSDAMLIKTDPLGEPVWEKDYGTLLDDKLYSIKATEDGDFVASGTVYFGIQDVAGWLLKIDAYGDSLWSKFYGDIKQDLLFAVAPTSDGGYILSGGFRVPSTFDYDFWLIKTDSSGSEQWSKTLDYDNDTDISHSVQQTSDGGYIITGQAAPFDGGLEAWVVKTDSLGNILWDKLFPFFPDVSFNNPIDGTHGGNSVKQTADGGYIIAGYSDKFQGNHLDVYLVRIASDIIPVELTNFTAGVNQNKVTLNWQTATETNNSGFELQRNEMSNVKGQTDWQVVGFVPGFGTTTEPKSYSFIDENLSAGKYQYRLKQIDFDGSFEYFPNAFGIEVEIPSPTEFSLEQNYPNPFNPSTNIKYTISSRQFVTLKIFNSLGEEIETLVNEIQDAGVHSKLYILHSTLPSGVYYYQLNAGGQALTSKMILLR